MLTTLALGYPHVAFSLYNHGQQVFTLQAHAAEAFATAISQRARDLLAENFQKDVITVDERDGSIHLQGLIGLPSNTRHTRQGGYLFINARPVVCPAISFAIRDGYGTRIAPDRHPVFVLSLTIPSHLLDVNVHPQKKEVRLSDESAIKQVVQRAISSALDQSMHKEPFYIEPPVFSDFCFEKFEGPSHDAIEKAPRQFYMAQVKAPIEQIDFSFPLDDVHVIGFWGSFLLVDALSLADKGPVKMDSGLCLVDLSAAKARIAFENLLKVKEHPIKGQKIMFPFSMQMGLSEISSLISSIDLLDKMGFGIAQTAPRSIIVDALPPDMDENAAKEALIEMAELSITLDREGGNELEGKRVRAFAKIALRYGKNSANISSAANGREILKALFQTSSPYFCPEGKKTIVYLSERDVQNYFR